MPRKVRGHIGGMFDRDQKFKIIEFQIFDQCGTKNQRLVGDGRFVGETPQNLGIRQFWVYQTSSVDCTQCDGTPLRATPGNLRNIVDLHWQQPSFETRGVGIRGVDDGR